MDTAWASMKTRGKHAEIQTVTTTIEIHVPDELRRRMDDACGEDWSEVARQAIERHLERLVPPATAPLRPPSTDGDEQQPGDAPDRSRFANAAYAQGYAWARDRAVTRDLRAMVNAPNYQEAINIVRGTSGFAQRDEFGDYTYLSDEMWEAFVDGAVARYNEGSH